MDGAASKMKMRRDHVCIVAAGAGDPERTEGRNRGMNTDFVFPSQIRPGNP